MIPELPRPEALEYVSTHIGHSRKRSLSPEERYRLMTQGQYGIGLLGFWGLGNVLEMRSCLPGQEPYRLILRKEDPEFDLAPLRGGLNFDDRWTEVLVVDLGKEAQAARAGAKADPDEAARRATGRPRPPRGSGTPADSPRDLPHRRRGRGPAAGAHTPPERWWRKASPSRHRGARRCRP